MGYLLEALLAGWIVCGTWRIARQDVVRNGLGLTTFLAALAAAGFVFWVAGAASASLFGNLFLKAAVPVGASLATFTAVSWALRRWIARREGIFVHAGQQALARVRGGALAARLLFPALFLALSVVLLVVGATLLSLLPGHEGVIERTLVLRLFRPSVAASENAPGPPPGDPSLGDIMAAQNRFFRKTSDLLGHGRDWVGDQTGMTRLSAQIHALRAIVNLSDDEKRWVVRTRPEVWRLTRHPALLAALEDERVLQLIADVGRGDVTAIYALGEEPAIRALDDADLARTIRSIDLTELSTRVERRRREIDRLARHALRVPQRWLTASLRSTLDLDETLARMRLLAQRTPGAGEDGALDWPDATTLGVGWTVVEVRTEAPHPLRFLLDAAGRLTLRVDGRSIPLEEGTAGRTATVLFPPGRSEVVILADFTDEPGPRTCDVGVFRDDPGSARGRTDR